jgi:type IV secretion system protein VirB5
MGKKKETQQVSSPYLLARREWNERYGSYIARAKVWRRVALTSLVIAAVAVGGVVHFASQNKLIPYVVEVGGDGRPLQVYYADEAQPLDQRVIRAQLGQFVQDMRSVSTDVAVQRRAVERAYAHLSADMPAYTAVNQWFRQNVPFERATEETVVVEVRQVLPLSDKTWRIEWVERPRSRNGESMPATRWTGTATIVTSGEVNPQTLLYNPTGLYIKEFDWSRDFSGNN